MGRTIAIHIDELKGIGIIIGQNARQRRLRQAKAFALGEDKGDIGPMGQHGEWVEGTEGHVVAVYQFQIRNQFVGTTDRTGNF